MKLNVKAFGLTCGVIWGLGVFCLTWWVMAFDGATRAVPFLGHLYRGYNISAWGSAVGLLWALPDGFIGGIVFAWLYNLLASRFAKGAVDPARS